MPKNTLLKFQTITAGNASGNLTSAVTNIQRLDDVGIQVNVASGTPSGILQVQISADYSQDNNGNVLNAGHWVDLNGVSQTLTAGAPSPVYFDMEELSAPWIRLVFTHTGGSGTIDAFITAKQI